MTAMRVIKLRKKRSDAGRGRTTGSRVNASRRDRRLCIKTPLVVGNKVETPDGFVYELLDEFDGVARLPIAKHKRIVPRVLVWGFCCSACGERAKTACVASEKPVAGKCAACLTARRRAR